GSGAPKPVPLESVKLVKAAVPDAVLIVGGGIRDPDTATQLAQAGADVIVTGNIVEDSLEKAVSIVRAVKSVRKSS
ncbi:MAG: geranylgeranylglyceryl/heptaprenylglyceryl phosphate synthase, partial [Sulfolobales archaeon]